MMMSDGKSPTVEVTFLGRFSISINGRCSADFKNRSRRVWFLVQYLLANRRKDVSVDVLMEALWEEEEYRDPLNALKNLVYRAREYLKQLSGDSNFEFIQFVGNTYRWNNNCNCNIDTEQLVDDWKLLNDGTVPEEKRIQACNSAVELYRGEFLPKASDRTWVISMSAWFGTVYRECILKGCNLLAAKEQFEQMIPICQLALLHAPFDENIHKMLIYAYISLGQSHKAFEHYNKTVSIFAKELDVNISESLSSVYKQVLNSINHNEVRLENIKKDLQEAAQTKGAYFCEYDVFRSICQLRARMYTRDHSTSSCILLLTLTDPDGGDPETEDVRVPFGKLREAIFSCLRSDDIFSAYSATQYIVLLVFNQYGNAETVINRISRKFHSLYGLNNVKLAFQTDALDAVK